MNVNVNPQTQRLQVRTENRVVRKSIQYLCELPQSLCDTITVWYGGHKVTYAKRIGAIGSSFVPMYAVELDNREIVTIPANAQLRVWVS